MSLLRGEDLNHWQSTARYAHLSQESLRRAAELAGDRFGALLMRHVAEERSPDTIKVEEPDSATFLVFQKFHCTNAGFAARFFVPPSSLLRARHVPVRSHLPHRRCTWCH